MSANAGQTTGFVAISRNREVLYYKTSDYSVLTETKKVQAKDPAGNPLFDDGNPVMVEKTVFKEFRLPEFDYCSRENSAWKADEVTAAYLADNFYYRYEMPKDADGNPTENYVDATDLYYEDDDGDLIPHDDYEAIISRIGVFHGNDGNFYK